jgi:hypothetical protein
MAKHLNACIKNMKLTVCTIQEHNLRVLILKHFFSYLEILPLKETYKPTLTYIKNFPSSYSPLQANKLDFQDESYTVFTCICKFKILIASYNYIPKITKHFFLPSQFYTFGFKSIFFTSKGFPITELNTNPTYSPALQKQEWCNTLFTQRSKLAN